MKNTAKSSFIFDLIDEYKILSHSGKFNVWTDEDLEEFCKKYKAESIIRDAALFQYVNSTPNLFRCHLPYSKWALVIANNVMWYYDELILTDPLLFRINNPLPNKEDQKYRLQEIVSYIYKFQECINGGYILFGGDHIIPSQTNQFKEVSDVLVNNTDVLTSFESFSQIGEQMSIDDEGVKEEVIKLLAQYEGMWGDTKTFGMYLPPNVDPKILLNGIYYDFMTPYNRISKEQLTSYGKQDMLDGLKKEYSKDISVVLETITNAQRLNTPVLFYRDVDCVVAKQYALDSSNVSNKLIASTSVYDCSLPYIEGIAPEKLFVARTQIPEAFIEFRAFLYDLVIKTMKESDNPEEIKFKIDSKISTMYRVLEIEMRNAQRKWKFHGIAAPALVGLGSLSLYSSGIDYSALISTLLGTGGLVRSLTTWSDVTSDIEKIRSKSSIFFMESTAVKCIK